MSGTSKSTQDTSQQQSSTTAPWAPTQGLLTDIIGGLNGQTANAAPTSAEQGALGTIQQNAQGMPNFGTQATDLTNSLFSGGTDRTGMVTDANNNYQQSLSPYMNADYLDPMKTPGMQGILDTIRGDVSNSVNGQFAGAGRDMSGMNQQALARGISQGEAVPLLNQYNQNVSTQRGAQDASYGAGIGTAGALSGLDQTALGNRMQGMTAASGIPDMMNMGVNSVLAAGQTARGLPLNNLGMLENLSIPLAGLGSQSTGTATGQTRGTQTLSPAQQAWGWMNSGSNMLKAWNS